MSLAYHKEQEEIPELFIFLRNQIPAMSSHLNVNLIHLIYGIHIRITLSEKLTELT